MENEGSNSLVSKHRLSSLHKEEPSQRNKTSKVIPELTALQSVTTPFSSEVRKVVKTRKREGYLSWDEYFLAIAVLSSKRSKDPLSPSGACIVDDQNRVVAVGYNGFPVSCCH
eukprot:scaffold2201_cov119-Cylindrotheca_fusiformis.AAC.5